MECAKLMQCDACYYKPSRTIYTNNKRNLEVSLVKIRMLGIKLDF